MILLNKACVQFEPNDPDFIRVTHRIYDYVNEVKDYNILYSTRFFGTMVFYLAWYKKLDNLVAYFLKEGNTSDCVQVIKLYLILHPNETKTTSDLPDLELIQVNFNLNINFNLVYIGKLFSIFDLFRRSSKTI